MKEFLFLFLMPLVLILGSASTEKSVVGEKLNACNCPIDTIMPDSIKNMVQQAVSQPVDSLRKVKQLQLDSVNTVKDSLTTVIKQLVKEKGRRIVIDHEDYIPAVPPVNGRPKIPPRTIKWLFWKYPDGSKQFYKTKTIVHK